MIVVYAMGGGLGHLARARRVLEALGAPGECAAVITASPMNEVLRFDPDVELIVAPRDRARFPAWLRDRLRGLAPDTVVVDAFPLGLLGELADARILPAARLVHVARLLRWDAYRAACPGAPRRYDATFAVEPLTPPHAAFLEAHSHRVERLSLAASAPLEIEQGAPWLVSHSGPDDEIERLRAFAEREARRRGERARIVVRSPRRAPVHEGPCGMLVTACGFNSMLEGAALGDRHLFLPLPRRYDHQPLRAARRRRALREARA